MSDNQIPMDEAFDEGNDPSVAEESPSAAPEPRLPEEVKIGDQTYRREEVEEVFSEFGGDWRKMQAAHTRRSQEAAAERRELEREKAEIARMKAELADRQNGRQNTSDYDEDDPVQQLLRSQQEIKERLERQEQRYQASMAELEQQNKWDAALDSLRGKPLVNEDEIKQYAAAKKLGPEHIDTIYMALYARRLGEAYGEASAASRYRAPVMGSTPLGVSPGMGREFDKAPPPVSETAWEDFERMAVDDPAIG